MLIINENLNKEIKADAKQVIGSIQLVLIGLLITFDIDLTLDVIL